MPINLYSPDPADPTSLGAPVKAAGRQIHQRRQAIAEKFFGTGAASRQLKVQGASDLRKIGQVVDQYGIDQVIDLMNQSAQIYKGGKEGVEDLRLQMEQARANNDVDEYRRLMGQSLSQKQRNHDINMTKDARFWNVITAALGGISKIVGMSYDQSLWDKFMAELNLQGVSAYRNQSPSGGF